MKKARRILIASMILVLLLLTRVSALASITVTVIPNIPEVGANTGSTHQYSNHWQYWSQGASAYPDNTSSGLRNMRRFGCRVVAQSKLLVEAGLASSDVSVFNPDIYFAWAAQNGYQDYSPWENAPIGAGVIAWGKSKGTTITMTSESYTGNPTQVMNYINAGKYVIMDCSDHQAYIGRAASLSFGEPVVLDSGSSTSSNPSLTKYLRGYDTASFDTVYIYTVGPLPCTLDVNGFLDGAHSTTLKEYGTFDVYIKGVLKADDVNDYYVDYPQNTSYEIKDIKANPGYEYLGVKYESLKGTLSGSVIRVVLEFARQGNLRVEGNLDSVSAGSITGYGTFDVYINGKLDESSCTSYNKQWPRNTAYEIKNIQTADSKTFDPVASSGLSGVISSATESKALLSFVSDGNATTEWQIGRVLPANLDPELLDIEYQHHYEKASASSPGADWVQGSVNRTYYQNSGSIEEYPYEKTTSDAYVYVGGYYFHWCGSNNNCNYLRVAGKYETYHQNDLGNFYVAESGTDTNNSAVKWYKLKWIDGQWKDGYATCATGQSASFYRMYQYQPKVLITEYNWSKDTDWTDTLDSSATSHLIRWRLKGGIPLAPDAITEIIAPDSVSLLVGETAHIEVKVIPYGVDLSVLNYQIADPQMFEIDSNNNIHCKYAGANTSTTLTITAPNGVTKIVRLVAKVSSTSQWQENSEIPENIDRELLNIEYKHHYETVAASSPGTGWVQGSVNRTYYQNSGSVEEYPYEKTTSDAYVYVGGYYFHWCGSNNNCNYLRVAGKYETYHQNDLGNFYVAETGTDTNNSAVKWYKLKWIDGQWKDGYATCATGQTSAFYRMYQYQPRVLITEYNWSKDTNWTDTLDSTAANYQVRWRLNPQTSQKSMYLPARTKVLEKEAFAGSSAKYFFLPDSVTSIGDNVFPDNSYVFLNTANLDDYLFQANNVWFIEIGSYNEEFATIHGNYLLRAGSSSGN